MVKVSLAALAALCLVAFAAASFARDGHKTSLSFDTLLAKSRPENILKNMPAAAEALKSKAREVVSSTASARKNVPTLKQPKHATHEAFARVAKSGRGLGHPALSRRSGATTTRITEHIDKMATKLGNIFSGHLNTNGPLKARSVASEVNAALPSGMRREGHEAPDCDDLGFMGENPTNEELENVCTDVCCQYKPILAEFFELSVEDINEVVCMKDADAYCGATVPAFISGDAPPSVEDLDGVCESPCRASWTGIAILSSFTDGEDGDEDADEDADVDEVSRRQGHMKKKPEPRDWDAVADWLCSEDGDSYCVIGDQSALESDDMTATLDLLCGNCKDFYFNEVFSEAMGETPIDLRDWICDKDGSDNYCATLVPPDLGEAPSNDDVALLCDSPCLENWLQAVVFSEGGLRRGGHLIKDAAEFAATLCQKDGDDFCLTKTGDLDTIGEMPTPANLTYVCSSACSDHFKMWTAISEDVDLDMLEAAFCAKSGEDFCILTMPELPEVPTMDGLNTLCGSTDCSTAWVTAAFLLGDDEGEDEDADGGDEPGVLRRSSRRAGHLGPASIASAFCAKDGAEFCIMQWMALEGQDGITEDGINSICGTGPCASSYPVLLMLFAGDSDEDAAETQEGLDFLCAFDGAGNNCFLSAVTALTPPNGMMMGDMGAMLPTPLLDLMCGDCLAKLGPEGASGLIFLALLGGAFDEEDGQRRDGHEESLGVLINLMCLSSDTGYCLNDPQAMRVLEGDGEFFESILPGDLQWDPARAENMTIYCENTCVNSFTQIAIELSTSTALVECLPPSDQFFRQIINNGCYRNGDAYCLQTFAEKFALGPGINVGCGISEDFAWDGTCSEETCKPAAEALLAADGWGCCAGSLDFSIIDRVETACSLTASECEAVGSMQIVIGVGNLKSAWLNAKLSSNPRIVNALKADVAEGVGAGKNVIKDFAVSARSGGGSDITCNIEAQSDKIAKGILLKLKKGGPPAGGMRRASHEAAGVNIAFSSLAAEIPAEELAQALEDPSAALTGSVDTEAITTTGAALQAIEDEVDDEIDGGGEESDDDDGGDIQQTTPQPGDDGDSAAARTLSSTACLIAAVVAASMAARF